MNLPNKLTVLRLVMIPVFFISFSLPEWFGPFFETISAILMFLAYIIAELSDLLDGKIARKYNLVTDLGKVMDPFADCLSHLTYFVCFYGMGIMPAFALLIILWREFSISFLRMLMMGKGKAVAANIWGKLKTCFYALTSVLSLVYVVLSRFTPGEWEANYRTGLFIFFSLAALFSFLSFTTYLKAIVKSKALSGMTR